MLRCIFMGFPVLRSRALAALLLTLAFSSPLWASTVIYRTDAQLIALSERVVHGRVVSQRTIRGGPAGETIYTVTTLQIIEDLTGVRGTTVEIWELGGAFGDEFLYVGGAVEYRVGDEVLVCLERGPRGLRSVAMGFSKFDVFVDANGERALRRSMRETVVVGGGAAAAATRERTLAEFRALATLVTGRQAQAGLAADPGGAVSQPYTFLGPFRWVEADSGTPVVWYKNTTAPPPLDGGLDAVAQIQTALAAWTNPSSASIVLQYNGTTFQSDADGPWSGIPSNSGVITFEDPNNEMASGVLAIGGGWAGPGQSTANGMTFSNFTRGYVIFNNGLTGSYRQPTDFSRVLEHEIGHTIGLGHTDSTAANIMYFSCCHLTTPLPPAIGPDDLAGLNFIYPASGGACTYSISPTSANVASGAGTGSVTVNTQAGCSWSAASNSLFFISVTSGSSGSGPGTVGYSYTGNPSISPRSGTMTIAGQTFTLNQAGVPCAYSLNPTVRNIGAPGGTGSVSITAQTGCGWTAVSNAGFISITSTPGGSGNGSINYNVSSNSGGPRSGTISIGGQTFTVNQAGAGPTVTLDTTSLNFGSTLNGSTVMAQTGSQPVRLTQSAGATVSWTVSSSQPWLIVSPASGSGSRTLSVSVNPAGRVVGTHQASLSFTLTGAGNFVGPISVTLRVMNSGSSSFPFGVIDTPTNNATGVVGAIPVTGWALDDVEVANVRVCRNPVAGEPMVNDSRCSGAMQIFLGEAVFVAGARPDVAQTFPTHPRFVRGGWGFMVLTNMLPNQGNGTFTLQVHAADREGRSIAMGSRVMTCNNAQATRPFGAIDTPIQGGTASGSSYINFGWALTPLPKSIPLNGSTISVYVDGASLGTVTYNNYRSDIATLFPGYANSNGAVGFRIIDTTVLADGLHTISWVVTDNLGISEGIGSRYFDVANSSGAMTAAVDAPGAFSDSSAAAVGEATLDLSPVLARRGWDPESGWRSFAPGRSGRTLVRAEEIGRVELRLGLDGDVVGYSRVGETLAPLPVGAQLDPRTGTFTWAPGVGYVGNYDLSFVQRVNGQPTSRKDVRIVLYPKGSGFVGPQIVIDTPTADADVAQPFLVAGWATDLSATEDTGVTGIHAWAYPLGGGPPLFLGAGAYGGVRDDVAAVHGDRARESGYGLLVQGLTPGTYDLAVFAWSTELADFAPAKVVRVTVR